MIRSLVQIGLIAFLAFPLLSAQSKPRIRVSPERVQSGDQVLLTGTGFTPNNSVMSHLLRPNGSEYNPLRFRTDEHGEFSHKIDTVMLDHGNFESWAEDEGAKIESNHVSFFVE